jgi:hypothetical protein
MRTAAATSTTVDTVLAVTEAYRRLVERLGGRPDLAFVYSTVRHDADCVADTLRRLDAHLRFVGGTSAGGVMTQDGMIRGAAIGLFGVVDPEGAYGTASAVFGDDPRGATRRAVLRALERAGRPGEVPSLVWMTPAPGCEEAVIRAIDELFGANVPIVGGSSGNELGPEPMRELTEEGALEGGVALSVLFPSSSVSAAYSNGYEPAGPSGVVTRATGRTVLEIDGRRAGDVLDEWAEGRYADVLSGGSIFERTYLTPVGQLVDSLGGMPLYKLAHPIRIQEDGGVTFFAELPEGARIAQMRGTVEAIVRRPARVARTAAEVGGFEPADIAGALVVFCTGCMLGIGDGVLDVPAAIGDALPDVPFLGVFTFGEQGCTLGGANHHGNMMISVLLFGRAKR